jgi:mRNA interferase MazF
VPRQYVPRRGDIIWLQFTPQAGQEQSGRRPAWVISPEPYNRRAGLALVCPVTSEVKGYPFEVVLPAGLHATGAILTDQVKSLDWRPCKAKRVCTVPSNVLEETIARILAVISPVRGRARLPG